MTLLPDRWHGVLALLDTRSADGRVIASPPDGAPLTHSGLPLPLLAVPAGETGGQITRLRVEGGQLLAEGTLDLGSYAGREIAGALRRYGSLPAEVGLGVLGGDVTDGPGGLITLNRWLLLNAVVPFDGRPNVFGDAARIWPGPERDPLAPPPFVTMLAAERWLLVGSVLPMIAAGVAVWLGGPLWLFAVPAAGVGAGAVSVGVRAVRARAWEQAGLAAGTLVMGLLAAVAVITDSVWAYIALGVIGGGGAVWQLLVSHYRDGPRLRALAERIERETRQRRP